ncbi:MAG: hypothetical protein M3R13_11245 [Armatimonadota bacterium]|nr:hypothetical protein [Armatimonadota bacterium]
MSLAFALCAVAAMLPTMAFTQGNSGTPTPQGFIKYLVYMAEMRLNGEPLLLKGPADVDVFQRAIMGRSPAQIAQNKAAAEAFFLQRYGLDFTQTAPNAMGVESISGAMLSGFRLNPKANYRAYTISEERVPGQGWEVRDGGWSVVLEGDQLVFGEYGGASGKLVKDGAMIVFGDYNIAADRPGRHNDRPIIIQYFSGSPIIADMDGVTSFVCDVAHPQWGAGKARGLVEGRTIRNVVTFPPARP